MRVLMLASDRSVADLAAALVRAGHGIDLLTQQASGEPADEDLSGVRVARVPEYPPMLERANRFAPGTFDVIHAHGWEVAWAAGAAKNLLGAPLVSTLVNCEQTRAGPDLDEVGKLILQAEWWLTYESRATVVPSEEVRDQIEDLFELPSRKQAVIEDPADGAATIEVYARAIADEAELSRRGEERPPLRVILGRAHLGSD